MSDWTSVKDSLPLLGSLVDVYVLDGAFSGRTINVRREQAPSYLSTRGWEWTDKWSWLRDDGRITHWMYSPDPPENGIPKTTAASTMQDPGTAR
jgi:hypothetical protein